MFIWSERERTMNNAEKFQEVFGYYATEMWAKSELEFLKWINKEYEQTESGDYIKRGDVIELLNNAYVREDNVHLWRDHNNDCIDKLMNKLQGIPSVNYGKWIFDDPLRADFECSECLERNDICTRFCPNCGAYMRGENNE